MYNEKYFQHATQHYMTKHKSVMERLEYMPVCPKCERLAIPDKGYKAEGIVYCPYCGYRGKTDLTYGIHVRNV